MTKQTFRKSLVALAVGSVCSSPALAEDYTTGTLQGVVQDTAGNPVPNATVTVTSDKGIRRTVTADDDGSVRVPQLPIGEYTVTISKDGYNELVSSNVPIQIGALGAFTFTMASQDEAMEEIYVTGTRQGSWDFNSTTTGITVDVGEAFSQAPLGRDATSVVLLAPGTSLGDSAFSTLEYGASGNIASFAGSSVGENVYYVNGMNITNFRNFVGGSTIPFELFDQIEVKTGGYQAEFGRSTGGVTNAVTKSGSNEWDFGVNAYFTPDSLYEDAPATFAAANQYDETESLEFNLWASGAIIKDKLFFFALYNPRDITEFDCASGSCTEEANDSPFYALKLDFVPWEGHRAEYTFFSDDQTRDVSTWRYTDAGNIATGDADAVANTPLSDFQGERVSDSKYVNGGENHIFRYTAALTDWMTLSALWGENEYQRSNYSTTDTPWTSSLIDPVTHTNGAEYDTGNWSVDLWEIGEDKRENLRFDADFYFDLVGDHHVRLGWDQEDLSSSNDAFYSGNLRARAEVSALSPTGYRWRTRQYYNEGSFGTKQTAYYLQDSWQVLDSLTLNLGVRNETFENSNKFGDVYVETKDQVAPRLGFSWDPFNNSNSRVYGSYGHYYLPIATNTNMRLAGEETYFQEYYEGFDADGDGFPDVGGDNYPVYGRPAGARTYFADGTMPFAEATKATDLDPLYQSEWILGVEHTFADEWTVGIRYVSRELESLIEDVAIDAGVRAWAEPTAWDDDPALATVHRLPPVRAGEPGFRNHDCDGRGLRRGRRSRLHHHHAGHVAVPEGRAYLQRGRPHGRAAVGREVDLLGGLHLVGERRQLRRRAEVRDRQGRRRPDAGLRPAGSRRTEHTGLRRTTTSIASRCALRTRSASSSRSTGRCTTNRHASSAASATTRRTTSRGPTGGILVLPGRTDTTRFADGVRRPHAARPELRVHAALVHVG